MKFRWYAAKAFQWLKGFVTHIIVRLPASQKTIVLIDLRHRANISVLRMLLIHLDLTGFQPIILGHFNLQTFWAIHITKWHSNLKVLWALSPSLQTPIFFTDSSAPFQKITAARTITLDYDYFLARSATRCHAVMPYTMHPAMYIECRRQCYDQIETLRQTKRRIRILFAGNYNNQNDGYDNPFFREQLGKMTRFEILDHLMRTQQATIVETQADLAILMSQSQDYRSALIIIPSTKLRIDPAEWLPFIAQADFFLCAPGVVFPMCHNAIEAMAVGTIPWTNYADWFIPALQSMTNCVSFTSPKDLENSLKNILEMPEKEIENLRRSVLAYYDEVLRSECFAEKIRSPDCDTMTIHALNEDRVALSALYRTHFQDRQGL